MSEPTKTLGQQAYERWIEVGHPGAWRNPSSNWESVKPEAQAKWEAFGRWFQIDIKNLIWEQMHVAGREKAAAMDRIAQRARAKEQS